MALILIVLFLLIVVDADQERLDEAFDLFTLERARVIGVNGVEDALVDLGEFVFVRQNVMQVVDGLVVIHFAVFFLLLISN